MYCWNCFDWVELLIFGCFCTDIFKKEKWLSLKLGSWICQGMWSPEGTIVLIVSIVIFVTLIIILKILWVSKNDHILTVTIPLWKQSKEKHKDKLIHWGKMHKSNYSNWDLNLHFSNSGNVWLQINIIRILQFDLWSRTFVSFMGPQVQRSTFPIIFVL